MRFGWFALLLFATLGIALESMHGFKVGWYLDVENEVRRRMWRLAHAHGGLLAIVNILYALVAGSQEPPAAERLAKASPLLIAAALLLPLGFFLGGSGLMAETRSSVFSWFRSGRSASLPDSPSRPSDCAGASDGAASALAPSLAPNCDRQADLPYGALHGSRLQRRLSNHSRPGPPALKAEEPHVVCPLRAT